MLSPQAELIWQGRIHLGDEPGIFGDADYPGLALELPITLERAPGAQEDTTTLVLRTEGVNTFSGYPGHLVTVTLYTPGSQPNVWKETVLTTARLTTADNDHKNVEINLAGQTPPYRVSVRVRVDTAVPAGLYDDFVFTSLSNKSADFAFVASFGFH
jgi:hypothetical protein